MEEVKPVERAPRKRSLDGGAKAAATRRPEHSERMREIWQDPAMREMMLKRRKAAVAKRKREGNPINTSRFGIPDGMRRDIAKRFWKQARFEATLTMKKLDKAGVTDDLSEDAREALKKTLEIMRMPLDQKVVLQAARQVLDFTMAKPTQKQDVTVRSAEAWLEEVTKDNDEAVAESDAPDAQASP